MEDVACTYHRAVLGVCRPQGCEDVRHLRFSVLL